MVADLAEKKWSSCKDLIVLEAYQLLSRHPDALWSVPECIRRLLTSSRMYSYFFFFSSKILEQSFEQKSAIKLKNLSFMTASAKEYNLIIISSKIVSILLWVRILSIETVTSVITAAIQLANQSAVSWRPWEIVNFSYIYSSKLKAFGWWEKFEVFGCNVLNIDEYFIGSVILRYCLASILWEFINSARYWILIKPLKYCRTTLKTMNRADPTGPFDDLPYCFLTTYFSEAIKYRDMKFWHDIYKSLQFVLSKFGSISLITWKLCAFRQRSNFGNFQQFLHHNFRLKKEILNSDGFIGKI